MRNVRVHRSFFAGLLALSLCCTQAHAQADPSDTLAPNDDDEITTTVEVPADTEARFNIQPVPAVNERPLEDSVVDRLRNDPAYWYANVERKKKKPKIQNSREFTMSDGTKSLIWVLIIGIFVGLLVWILLTSDVGVFRKRSRQLEAGEELDDAPEDIHSVDFPSAIARAEADGNYRLAVRLHYLSALKELSETGLITYTQERTNSDYLRQLSGTSYYRTFFRVTRAFEYSWYGQFAIDADTYDRVRSEFADFKQSLRP